MIDHSERFMLVVAERFQKALTSLSCGLVAGPFPWPLLSLPGKILYINMDIVGCVLK